MTQVGFCFSHVGQIAGPVFSRLQFLRGHSHFGLVISAHRNSPKIVILSGSFFVVCLFLLDECLFPIFCLSFQLLLFWSLSWAVKNVGCKGTVFNSLNLISTHLNLKASHRRETPVSVVGKVMVVFGVCFGWLVFTITAIIKSHEGFYTFAPSPWVGIILYLCRRFWR